MPGRVWCSAQGVILCADARLADVLGYGPGELVSRSLGSLSIDGAALDKWVMVLQGQARLVCSHNLFADGWGIVGLRIVEVLSFADCWSVVAWAFAVVETGVLVWGTAWPADMLTALSCLCAPNHQFHVTQTAVEFAYAA